jgi:hypothetical protein
MLCRHCNSTASASSAYCQVVSNGTCAVVLQLVVLVLPVVLSLLTSCCSQRSATSTSTLVVVLTLVLVVVLVVLVPVAEALSLSLRLVRLSQSQSLSVFR